MAEAARKTDGVVKKVKKILIVAETTEDRIGKKAELMRLWGKTHQINSASHARAIGVCKEMLPDIIIILMIPGSALVYEEMERILNGSAEIFFDGYDKLPATI